MLPLLAPVEKHQAIVVQVEADHDGIQPLHLVPRLPAAGRPVDAGNEAGGIFRQWPCHEGSPFVRRHVPPHADQLFRPGHTSLRPLPRRAGPAAHHGRRTATGRQVIGLRGADAAHQADYGGMHVVGQTEKELAALRQMAAATEKRHGMARRQIAVGIILPPLIHHVCEEIEGKGRMHAVAPPVPDPFQPYPEPADSTHLSLVRCHGQKYEKNCSRPSFLRKKAQGLSPVPLPPAGHVRTGSRRDTPPPPATQRPETKRKIQPARRGVPANRPRRDRDKSHTELI